MPRLSKCLVCGGPVKPRGGNRSFPFCSERCRLVDLGRWLGEEYRIPAGRAGNGGGPSPPAEEEEDEA